MSREFVGLNDYSPKEIRMPEDVVGGAMMRELWKRTLEMGDRGAGNACDVLLFDRDTGQLKERRLWQDAAKVFGAGGGSSELLKKVLEKGVQDAHVSALHCSEGKRTWMRMKGKTDMGFEVGVSGYKRVDKRDSGEVHFSRQIPQWLSVTKADIYGDKWQVQFHFDVGGSDGNWRLYNHEFPEMPDAPGYRTMGDLRAYWVMQDFIRNRESAKWSDHFHDDLQEHGFYDGFIRDPLVGIDDWVTGRATELIRRNDGAMVMVMPPESMLHYHCYWRDARYKDYQACRPIYLVKGSWIDVSLDDGKRPYQILEARLFEQFTDWDHREVGTDLIDTGMTMRWEQHWGFSTFKYWKDGELRQEMRREE